LRRGAGSAHHAHDVGFFHDQEVLTVDLDLGAGPLAEQHAVASPHVERDKLAAFVPGARNERGEIVALDVVAGDRILFGKWSGTEVKIDGEELLIMKESDIMGIIAGGIEAKKAA
jgi:co-chaperonin GroES (HSP10)